MERGRRPVAAAGTVRVFRRVPPAAAGVRMRRVPPAATGLQPNRTKRGSAFLLAVAVLAGLTALLASFSATQHLSIRARQNRMDARRARLLADSAIERALAEFASSQDDPNVATLQDAWALLGGHGAERFLVGDGSFRMEIVDAGSFANLNTADQEQLLRLPLTTAQVDSLLDWRSADNPGRPEGGKDEYYNNLPNPYNTAERRLDTLDELFLVKDFSAQTLYAPSQDVVSSQFQVAGGP